MRYKSHRRSAVRHRSSHSKRRGRRKAFSRGANFGNRGGMVLR